MKSNTKNATLKDLPALGWGSPKISNIYQYLVWKFCKDPAKVSWPKEISIAKKMLAKYSEYKFWGACDFGFKLNSLCFLLTPKGKYLLEVELKKYKFRMSPKKKAPRLGEKVGEDYKPKPKRKKFFNFNHFK